VPQASDINWYPPTWRGRPAGMPRLDFPIWNVWMQSHAADYTAYAYDVLLPPLDVRPPTLATADLELWLRLNSLRIDAIAQRAGKITLFEVRPAASMQTLGQIITYRTTWPLAYPDTELEAAAIITNSASTALALACKQSHIRLDLVTITL
jgi:hypothetical protein